MNPADINALLNEAEKAKPNSSAGRGQWADLYPVYEKLRTKGLSCDEAMAWLVEQKAIAKDSAKKALNAFWSITFRLKRKSKATTQPA